MLVCAVCIYFGMYIVNAFNGGYTLELDFHPHDRWSPSAFYWQPAIGRSKYFVRESDWVGFIYSPLISIDRQLFHPAIVLGDEDSYRRSEKWEERDIHPAWRDEFRLGEERRKRREALGFEE